MLLPSRSGSASISRRRRSAFRASTSNDKTDEGRRHDLIMGYQLNFAPVWRDFDLLLSGLALGIGMALIAVLLVGNLIGLVAAFAMTSKSVALRRIAGVYVTTIRNLPIYFLMLVAFFVLPQQLGVRI